MPRPFSPLATPIYGATAFAAALLMVAASTLVGLFLAPQWGTGAVDLVYLPAVLAAGALAGRTPALVAGIASALAYNYFFTAPFRSFRILSPADVVTVLMLFLVAIVTSYLSSGLREQARQARDHASRNATIAGFARALLGCASEQEVVERAVQELGEVFRCNAILLTDASAPRLIAAAPSGLTLTPSDLAMAKIVLSTGEAAGRGISRVTTVEWQFRPVQTRDQVLAAVGLARDDGALPVASEQGDLLQSLLDQIALAIARIRGEAGAREVAATRERDQVRSALLLTIEQDLKQPIDTMAGAVADLRRSGEGPREPVSVLSAEVARLKRYLDNLLQLGPPSDQRPIEVGPISIDLYRRIVSRDGAQVHLSPKEYAVLAELAKHPGRVLDHAHLLRAVWGPAHEHQIDYLRVAIRGLRQKLEQEPSRPTIILNEPSVGYRLVA